MKPYVTSDTNPNEHFGVRACSLAAHQKSPDCVGPWVVVPTHLVRVANPLAPHVCICTRHGAEAFRPPIVKELPPRPARRARKAVEEELVL